MTFFPAPYAHTTVASLASIPSVMDKLPVEIVRNIFHLSLSHEGRGSDEHNESDEDEEGELSQPSPYFTGPLTISHVCRYWRQAAISFGPLWTYLKTRYDHPRIKYDMVHTWIERTNGLSLDFEIDLQLDDDGDVEQRRTLESVAKLLLAEQHRWRHVRFGWSFKAFSSEFTGIDMTNMPMLLSMMLHIDIRKCGGRERIVPNAGLARSRSVEEVEFWSEYAIEYGTEPLRYLKDEQQYFRDHDQRGAKAAETCLEALRVCPRLKAFHAVYTGFLYEDVQPEMSENRPHLVHEHIEELVLDDITGTFPELLINKVTLPNLRYLECRTTCFLETPAVSGLFQRSKPPLEMLKLCGTEPGDLISALRHVPSLDTLILEDVEDPHWIFEELSSTGDDDDDVICPDLLCLHLTKYGDSGGIHDHRQVLDALFELVESRADPGAPGEIVVNDDFVVPTSHIRREFEAILELLSKERDDCMDKNLFIFF